MAYTLPKLPYPYNALEPHLDAATMDIHHTKHHQTYVDKLNAALEKYPELQAQAVESLLKNLDTLPEAIRTPVRNHGGGHTNHTLFWTSLTPTQDLTPTSDLLQALHTAFGSFDQFKQQFSDAAATHFGSGWAWLALDASQTLKIYSLPNQDSPLSQGHQPLFGLDVWEHAYYLKYQNRRPDYIAAIWHCLNWPEIGKRFQAKV
ncbi:superoxide dismutase [Microgenomates group bacterium RBG_16_45_19]|nr:MAG: superoxide dismutase [Microgenomates group bacterium RBG_16_45_19]